MATKILLVDDEKDIVEFLQYNLEQEGFEVLAAYDGKEALEKMELNPDLVILDVFMPKMDGYEVCTKIRLMEDHKTTPVIFLTAKSSETDEIHGLNLGADDFIQKPISPKKLIARVKSNLRKIETTVASSDSNIIMIGPLVIDREQFVVILEGQTLIFPKKEFEIISYLASNPGKVFDRDKILNDVWGSDIYVVERTIDVHVRKIREKLGKYGNLIETVKGVGYRFKNIE
ncbi:MAG: response regulator transcription factor [Ignavibacteriaceae bacterium]|jgi:two-component system alkaline phosphatase synthesis response regulator PhoP|nr:response regulator transcription factor [Ignavibacteriaceae bacterium]